VNTSVPTITLESGEVIQADLVIGADGIHSKVRQSISSQPSKATPIGDAVYRIIVPAERMEADPALQNLLQKGQMHFWMGPERHIIGYPIVSGHHECRT
jgi:salicylate hydroxylase